MWAPSICALEVWVAGLLGELQGEFSAQASVLPFVCFGGSSSRRLTGL